MAIGLLVIAGRTLFVAPRRGGSRLRWMQRLTTMSPGQAFLAGLIIACSLQAVVIFLNGVIIISESEISPALRVIVLLVLITLTLILQIILIALYTANARRVRGQLLALIEWLNQHDRAITTGISLILGIIFLIAGLRGLIPVIITRS
ncbi:MAG TPA: GAP family protein [Ktedonobacterales bacterium]|jgi:hypothetical protein